MKSIKINAISKMSNTWYPIVKGFFLTSYNFVKTIKKGTNELDFSVTVDSDINTVWNWFIDFEKYPEHFETIKKTVTTVKHDKEIESSLFKIHNYPQLLNKIKNIKFANLNNYKSDLFHYAIDFKQYPEYFLLFRKAKFFGENSNIQNVKWEINVEEASLKWEDLILTDRDSHKIYFYSIMGDFDEYIRSIKLVKDGNRTLIIQNVKMKFSLGPLDMHVGDIFKDKMQNYHQNNLNIVKAKIEAI